MTMRFQIANRFTVLGIIAVVVGAWVTAAAFLWQEFLILRMVQRSYMGSIVQAAQTELRAQGLSPETLAGARNLTSESVAHLQMRLQIVDVPAMIQELGLRLEIAGPHRQKAVPPIVKSPYILIHDTAQEWQPPEPDKADVEDIV